MRDTELIDKACTWLEKNLDWYILEDGGVCTESVESECAEEFVERFRKYMLHESRID